MTRSMRHLKGETIQRFFTKPFEMDEIEKAIDEAVAGLALRYLEVFLGEEEKYPGPESNRHGIATIGV